MAANYLPSLLGYMMHIGEKEEGGIIKAAVVNKAPVGMSNLTVI